MTLEDEIYQVMMEDFTKHGRTATASNAMRRLANVVTAFLIQRPRLLLTSDSISAIEMDNRRIEYTHAAVDIFCRVYATERQALALPADAQNRAVAAVDAFSSNGPARSNAK